MSRSVGSRSGRAALWLAAPWLVGAILRFWRVHDQVLGDDEYHAVNAAVRLGFPELLVTYLPSDHCIPLSSLYRIWLAAVGPLTEMVLRAPVLLSGLVLLAVGPWWLDRRLGRTTALVFAWLLAVSPPLVLYSRIARSYMWMTCIGFLAAMAFWAWWRTGRARWGVAFAGLAGFGLWVHLGSGPFLAAPFLWLLGAKAWEMWKGGPASRRPEAGPGWGAAILLGLGTVLATLIFLAPAHETLLPLIFEKQGANIPMGWGTAGHVVHLAAGSGNLVAVAIFWLVVVGGWIVLGRRDPALATFAGVLVGVHVVGLLILSPLGLAHPIIFNRYVLIALPWVLVAAAEALAWGLERIRSTPLRTAVLVGVVLAWWSVGPLARASFVHGSFAHHNLYLLYSVEPPEPPPGTFPEIYARWARTASEEPGAVVEYPWFWFWNTNLSFPLAQEIHGRDVVTAMHLPKALRSSTRFRNTTPAAPDAVLESRGRYLLVHKDISDDELRIDVEGWMSNSRRPPSVSFERLVAAGRQSAEQLRRDWGPPFYEDPSVAAWDLDAVRARVAPIE